MIARIFHLPFMTINELENQTLSTLKAMARDMGLTGWTALRKQDLVYFIDQARNGQRNGGPVLQTTKHAASAASASQPKAAEAPKPAPRRDEVQRKPKGQTTAMKPKERSGPPSQRSSRGSDRHSGRGHSSSRRSRRDRHGGRGSRRRNRDARSDYLPKSSDLHRSDSDTIVLRSGLLDITNEGYGFLRSAKHSYMPGPSDVYLSQSQIRRFGLRPGDTVEGDARPPKDNERYFAMLQVKRINGTDPVAPQDRKDFQYLTPLYPEEQLQLETRPNGMSMRVMDMFAPIGKGQRGLIVAQPKTGKTILLQKIANAISTNHPAVHLLILLV